MGISGRGKIPGPCPTLPLHHGGYLGPMPSTEAQPRGLKVAFFALALIVGVVVILLAFNIARHALNHVSTTKVTVTVDNVAAIDANHVVITATLHVQSSQPAAVSCLVGVARPAMPLAFPIHLTENMVPGVDRQITVTRALLKPVASTVRISDVALTCT